MCAIGFSFFLFSSCTGITEPKQHEISSLCFRLFGAGENKCKTSCNDRLDACTEYTSEIGRENDFCSYECVLDDATGEAADQKACDACLYNCLEVDTAFVCDSLPAFAALGHPTDNETSVPGSSMYNASLSSSAGGTQGSSVIGSTLDTTMITGPNGLKDRYAILVRPADEIINLCETTEPSIIQSCESFTTTVDAKQTLELFQHYDCAGAPSQPQEPANDSISYRVVPIRFGPVDSTSEAFPAFVSAVENFDISLVCNINAEPVAGGYLATDGTFQPYNDNDADPENDTPIDVSGINVQFGLVYNSTLVNPITYTRWDMAASGAFEPATTSNSFACAFDKGVTFVIPEPECGDCNCRVVHTQTTTVSAYPSADKLIDLKAFGPVITPIPTVGITDPVLSSQAGISSNQMEPSSSAMLSSTSSTPLLSSMIVTTGDTYFTTPVTDTLERENRQSTKFLGSIVAERNTDSGDTVRTYEIYTGPGSYTSNHEFRFSYKSYNGKNDILVQTAEGSVVSSTVGVVGEVSGSGKTRITEIPFNTPVALVTTTHTLTFSFRDLFADSVYVVTIEGYTPR